MSASHGLHLPSLASARLVLEITIIAAILLLLAASAASAQDNQGALVKALSAAPSISQLTREPDEIANVLNTVPVPG